MEIYFCPECRSPLIPSNVFIDLFFCSNCYNLVPARRAVTLSATPESVKKKLKKKEAKLEGQKEKLKTKQKEKTSLDREIKLETKKVAGLKEQNETLKPKIVAEWKGLEETIGDREVDDANMLKLKVVQIDKWSAIRIKNQEKIDIYTDKVNSWKKLGREISALESGIKKNENTIKGLKKQLEQLEEKKEQERLREEKRKEVEELLAAQKRAEEEKREQEQRQMGGYT